MYFLHAREFVLAVHEPLGDGRLLHLAERLAVHAQEVASQLLAAVGGQSEIRRAVCYLIEYFVARRRLGILLLAAAAEIAAARDPDHRERAVRFGTSGVRLSALAHVDNSTFELYRSEFDGGLVDARFDGGVVVQHDLDLDGRLVTRYVFVVAFLHGIDADAADHVHAADAHGHVGQFRQFVERYTGDLTREIGEVHEEVLHPSRVRLQRRLPEQLHAY